MEKFIHNLFTVADYTLRDDLLIAAMACDPQSLPLAIFASQIESK